MSQQLEGSAHLESGDFDYSVVVFPDVTLAKRSAKDPETVFKVIGDLLEAWSAKRAKDHYPRMYDVLPEFLPNDNATFFEASTISPEEMQRLEADIRAHVQREELEEAVVGTRVVEPAKKPPERSEALQEPLKEKLAVSGTDSVNDKPQEGEGVGANEKSLERSPETSDERSEAQREQVLTELKTASSVLNKPPTDTEFSQIAELLRHNLDAMRSLSKLKAMGAHMAITSFSTSEIVLDDIADTLDAGAQERALLQLSKQEREAAIVKLEEQIPNLRTYLQRFDSSRGINYYECMVLCTAVDSELMPEDTYRDLWRQKHLDLKTVSWLLTQKSRLDRGVALRGVHVGNIVYVDEDSAENRFAVRGGRARLRVQVS